MQSPLVIVGAGLGGLRAAERLRAAGWEGAIVIYGTEPHLPYNRPPLSKEALATGISHERLAYRRRPAIEDVQWRLEQTVESVDLDEHAVTLEDGTRQAYVGLVAATGVRPRRLPLDAPLEWRQTLRTIDDGIALRERLTEGGRLVLIGAGFVGSEVAATARGHGCDVHVVDPLPEPMTRAIGEMVGGELRRRHESHGVTFHLGRSVAAIEGDTAPRTVHLDDGQQLTADIVVEAVGSIPNVEWLDGNGLDLTNGVACDEWLRPLRADAPIPDVAAVGDIVRYVNPRFGGPPHRVEHWAMPTETAKPAAFALMAHLTGQPIDEEPFAPLPTFWSDQYDIRLQSFGLPELGLDDVRVLEGDLSDETAVGYHRDGQLVGVLMLGLSLRMKHYRTLLLEQLP
ncbi:MAG TPA: FAD-dependent oxidoreductase [Nocardioidaceae bacterium]|nr:FAD-dependent oxidoreductase [Nocardioidaceae bacterium]